MRNISSILAILGCTLSLSYGEIIEIYPQISGEITSQTKQNQSFKKGEVLVSFDARQIDTKIVQYEGIVRLKKTLLDDANKILNENVTLYESTVASKRDVDMAQLEYDKAKSFYDIEVANLEYYKLEKEKYKILAPFNGIVKDIPNHLNVTNINQPKVLMVIESK